MDRNKPDHVADEVWAALTLFLAERKLIPDNVLTDQQLARDEQLKAFVCNEDRSVRVLLAKLVQVGGGPACRDWFHLVAKLADGPTRLDALSRQQRQKLADEFDEAVKQLDSGLEKLRPYMEDLFLPMVMREHEQIRKSIDRRFGELFANDEERFRAYLIGYAEYQDGKKHAWDHMRAVLREHAHHDADVHRASDDTERQQLYFERQLMQHHSLRYGIPFVPAVAKLSSALFGGDECQREPKALSKAWRAIREEMDNRTDWPT